MKEMREKAQEFLKEWNHLTTLEKLTKFGEYLEEAKSPTPKEEAKTLSSNKEVEEFFKEKFGNELKASDSWVLRFAEEYANQSNTVKVSEEQVLQTKEVEHFKNKCEEYTNKLEDVINELDLSELMIEEHGQHGTPPHELVKLVLEQKDQQIRMLKLGMKDFSNKELSKVSEWISVEEDLPEYDEQTFWIREDGYTFLDDINHDNDWENFKELHESPVFDEEPSKITHWQPLPEPPK